MKTYQLRVNVPSLTSPMQTPEPEQKILSLSHGSPDTAFSHPLHGRLRSSAKLPCLKEMKLQGKADEWDPILPLQVGSATKAGEPEAPKLLALLDNEDVNSAPSRPFTCSWLQIPSAAKFWTRPGGIRWGRKSHLLKTTHSTSPTMAPAFLHYGANGKKSSLTLTQVSRGRV